MQAFCHYANVWVCVDIPGVGSSASFDSTMGVKQSCPMSPELLSTSCSTTCSHMVKMPPSCSSLTPKLDWTVPILPIGRSRLHAAHSFPFSRLDAPHSHDWMVPFLLYADDIDLLSQSPSGLQLRLNVLQLFCAEELLSVNMPKTQVVMFSDFCHSHSDSFLYSHQQFQIVEQYPYLGICCIRVGHTGMPLASCQ